MKKYNITFCRILLFGLYTVVYIFGVGCSKSAPPSNKAEQTQTNTPKKDVSISIRPEQLFGTYIVADYSCTRGDILAEKWASQKVGREVVISKKSMRYFGKVIHNPRYLIHYYPHLSEGEVPDNIRRRFGSYMGFDNGRKDGGDLILGVHESSDKESPYYYLEILEVIDMHNLNCK